MAEVYTEVLMVGKLRVTVVTRVAIDEQVATKAALYMADCAAMNYGTRNEHAA